MNDIVLFMVVQDRLMEQSSAVALYNGVSAIVRDAGIKKNGQAKARNLSSDCVDREQLDDAIGHQVCEIKHLKVCMQSIQRKTVSKGNAELGIEGKMKVFN